MNPRRSAGRSIAAKSSRYALHATRAAVEEGVVPGGGVALIRAQKALGNLQGSNEDQAIGIKILSRSIEEPLR